MKNLTLRIDEKVLAEARKLAALKGTTVAKMVRGFLTALVEEGGADAIAAEKARRTLVELTERSRSARSVDWKWRREAIYEERMGRLHKGRTEAPGFAEAPPAENMEMVETAAARLPTLEEMTTDTDAPPVPGHDEWFRRQVRLALDDDKSGNADYKDFDEVAAEFGFNAR